MINFFSLLTLILCEWWTCWTIPAFFACPLQWRFEFLGDVSYTHGILIMITIVGIIHRIISFRLILLLYNTEECMLYVCMNDWTFGMHRVCGGVLYKYDRLRHVGVKVIPCINRSISYISVYEVPPHLCKTTTNHFLMHFHEFCWYYLLIFHKSKNWNKLCCSIQFNSIQMQNTFWFKYTLFRHRSSAHASSSTIFQWNFNWNFKQLK